MTRPDWTVTKLLKGRAVARRFVVFGAKYVPNLFSMAASQVVQSVKDESITRRPVGRLDSREPCKAYD